MKKTKSNRNKKKKTAKKRPPGPYTNLTTDERLDLLANIIIDRIIEEEKLYNERLKTDPKAKRIFENCDCERCKNKKPPVKLSK